MVKWNGEKLCIQFHFRKIYLPSSVQRCVFPQGVLLQQHISYLLHLFSYPVGKMFSGSVVLGLCLHVCVQCTAFLLSFDGYDQHSIHIGPQGKMTLCAILHEGPIGAHQWLLGFRHITNLMLHTIHGLIPQKPG